MDRIQIDALEVEENFASIRKWKGKGDHDDRRWGKEEAISSSLVRETQERELYEMNKLIRNLSHKFVKHKLESKSPPRHIQQGPNRSFNP